MFRIYIVLIYSTKINNFLIEFLKYLNSKLAFFPSKCIYFVIIILLTS